MRTGIDRTASNYRCSPFGARSSSLRLDDLAGLDAAGADADALSAALDFGLHRTEVNVPAPAADVVRVRDIVSELRTFAADLANLCHDVTPCFQNSRQRWPPDVDRSGARRLGNAHRRGQTRTVSPALPTELLV